MKQSIVLIIILIGRDGEIRTHDPMHPMHVRYQAALRPELIKPAFLSTLEP